MMEYEVFACFQTVLDLDTSFCMSNACQKQQKKLYKCTIQYISDNLQETVKNKIKIKDEAKKNRRKKLITAIRSGKWHICCIQNTKLS